MIAAALLIAAAAIVACGWLTGRSVPARIAALIGGATRPRMILGWAGGTAVAYGATSLVALLLLGRIDALWQMPPDMRMVAWSLGLPASADADLLLSLAGTLVVGIALGAALLLWARARGRRPIGIGYRSPAEARRADERWPAAALAIAAGIGEEAFFRLLLPLLFAAVDGSAAIGFVVSLAAFVALHRHQGWIGMIAVALLGAWFTYLYLLSGALWLVMALHALIDVHALVIRPWAGGMDAGRRGA